jgi:hypothetical protein
MDDHMTNRCQTFKITVSTLFPQGDPMEKIFWGYHFNEAKARDAALNWAAAQHGGVGIDTILKVEIID